MNKTTEKLKIYFIYLILLKNTSDYAQKGSNITKMPPDMKIFIFQ